MKSGKAVARSGRKYHTWAGMLAAIASIDDNIDDIKVQGVPEQAARDTVRELLDEALMPYAVDMVQAMDLFSG